MNWLVDNKIRKLSKYRETAHEKINKNYANPKFIPFIFHNLRG